MLCNFNSSIFKVKKKKLKIRVRSVTPDILVKLWMSLIYKMKMLATLPPSQIPKILTDSEHL